MLNAISSRSATTEGMRSQNATTTPTDEALGSKKDYFEKPS